MDKKSRWQNENSTWDAHNWPKNNEIKLDMLTKEEYDKLPEDQIFRFGLSSNSPTGIYMVNSNPDKILGWVAKKRIDGWCIYTHWYEKGFEFIENNGDKVYTNSFIKKLVPCDDEVFELYVP